MKLKNKILICTPVIHIPNLLKKFKKYFTVIYKPLLKASDINQNKKIKYIFTNPNMSKIKFDKKFLSKFKNLKVLTTASTGTNHIDLDYLKKNNIKLISLRSKKKIINKISSTSELAFALMLNSLRNTNLASNSVLKKKWEYLPFIGRQMDNLTVGIIGYGRLGKIFVKLLKPFKSKILIYEKKIIKKGTKKKFQVNLNTLLKNSDVIVLHIHADVENLNFINSEKLKKMKKNVIIVNTSRGEIISENDLVNFLIKNNKAKYAADVLSDEIKNKWNSKIFHEYKKNKGNIIITPHIGGMTIDAQNLAYNAVLDSLVQSIKK